jgi:predicted phage terminase large subunit-like protein
MTVQSHNISRAPSLTDVVAEQTRRSMLKFVTYMRADYDVALHHRAICKKLDAFARGEIKRLMIFVPPQHGKSELSSRYFPAYVLGKYPNKKVAICSYSDELAESFNNAVQRIIDTDEYRLLFPQTILNGYRPHWGGVLKGYKRNSTEFEIVGKKGSLRITSIPDGALTGHPVDIGIIDDPFKNRIAAESETMRRNVWDWYTDTFLTRLHNDSQQLLLMTRWHEDDLAGRLLTEDKERVQQGKEPYWEVVEFPAIKETQPTEIDPRQPGEVLWPARHNFATLMEKREKGGERSWRSLYQQQPTARAGNLIKTEKFGFITRVAFAELTRNNYVQWNYKVDGAYTSDMENDATALYASYFHEPTQTLYVRECKSVRLEWTPLLKYIPLFVKRNLYGPFSRIRIEPKANGLSIYQSLRDETGLNVEQYEWPFIEGVRMADKDKVTRATAITPKVNSGRVVLIEEAEENLWHDTFKAQCAAFPLGKNDDEVDCLVMDLFEHFFGDKAATVSSN